MRQAEARRAVRLAALFLVASAVACLLVEAGSGFREIRAQASDNGQRTFLKRQLAGAYSLELDPEFLLAAAELIPRSSTFVVQVGNGAGDLSPITMRALPPYALYWLLPRREVGPEQADWLLCYGCDLKAWGSTVEPRWSGARGETIALIRR